MQLPVLVLALLGLARPQLIDLDKINAYPDPVLVSAPLVKVSDDPPNVPASSVEPIKIAIGTTVAPASLAARRPRRSAVLDKRDGNCTAQPAGSGPVPSPDTADAFLGSDDISNLAKNAQTPDGYATVFTNKQASLSAPNYMSMGTLTTYDTFGCASECDQALGCNAFNIYVERNPLKDPNASACPDPPSTSHFKCTLWGVGVSESEANNQGQWLDNFHVVIGGSNAYNKTDPPPPVPNFAGPTELGGAINAPLDNAGHDTYMGFQFFPFHQNQGYDPALCATACTTQTSYNSQHTNADGSYQSCIFFNAYVLSQNGVPQGLYCSLYNQTWSRNYGTNYGQFRGSDRYTVSRSYTYSLNTPSNSSTSQPDDCLGDPSLINPSFEDSRSPYPYGWTITDDEGSGSYGPRHNTTSSSAGSTAFFMEIDARNETGQLEASQDAQTCSGKSYSISVDYKLALDNPTLGQHANDDCTLTLQAPSEQFSVKGGSYSEWRTLSGTFVGAGTRSNIDIVLNCVRDDYYYLLDNVQIKQV